MKEKEEMKCARKTRAGERRKPMARGKGGGGGPVHVPENWPPCRLPSLSLSLSLFLFLSPSPLPAVNATACMHRATTRYRPLHFSSLRANAWTEEGTRRRNRREMRRKREQEREGIGGAVGPSARGKMKLLRDAPSHRSLSFCESRPLSSRRM